MEGEGMMERARRQGKKGTVRGRFCSLAALQG